MNQAEKMEKASGWLASRYQILGLIARGGMAAVYLAFDTLAKKQVAIKILIGHLDQPEQYLPRFRREAKALAQLTHPHIVKVLDYGELEGRPFLVLEHMAGGTLKDKMGNPIPYRVAAQLLLPVARALTYAHQQGFVHRDVKPANILLSETGHPLLSDFGIAKNPMQDAPNGLTGAGVGIGTPEYMAPEQALGQEVDARADIYSLGVVFYELVTGQKPFVANSQVAILLKQAQEPLPRPRLLVPDLPEDVERMLFHVLAKNPADRFQTMQEFATALEKLFLGDRLSPAEAPPVRIPF